MELIECPLKQSKIVNDFNKNPQFIESFFDYSYKKQEDLQERLNELSKRPFQRDALVEHLRLYNKRYHCSRETLINIDKLANPNAVTIVGGQQAGIFTGPIYTIHKIITIIQMAKKQEELLNVPVIPIFWIAGEDHDFDEVNHIYSVSNGDVKKRKVRQENLHKQSVSDMEIDKTAVQQLLHEILKDDQETSFTLQLLEEFGATITKSESYIDLFSFLVHQLFKNSGIVLLDSHHKELRKLESDFFVDIVEKNELLNELFRKGAHYLSAEGYGEPLETSSTSAHLFYHHQGSRLLLERSAKNIFRDKLGTITFTKEELLKQIEETPHMFSNNVVTRPLMQEFLLPVLAFVGGPGEIAYWSTFKQMFHLFNFKVPPIVPRISLTIVDAKIQKWLAEYSLTVSEVMLDGTGILKEKLEIENEQKRINKELESSLQSLVKLHAPLKRLVAELDESLLPFAIKNEQILKNELTLLAKKIEKSIRQKHSVEFNKFTLVDCHLFPNKGLQERSLNIVPFLNKQGLNLVSTLMEIPFNDYDVHKIIIVDERNF